MAKCSCEAGVKVVLPCSGASNVGQISNEAAKRLDVEGTAKFFCTAGLGGHVSGMIASAKGVDKVLVLDGCPVGCAKACADGAGLTNYEHMVVTELGVAKKHDFHLPDDDIRRTVDRCREKLSPCKARA